MEENADLAAEFPGNVRWRLNDAVAAWERGEYAEAMEAASIARMQWEDAGSPEVSDDEDD